ncbi:MAG: chloride channel protein [Bacteroidetes bacterium]|nr:chloride channel protein [Bacteroidota bacterium]
MNRHLIYNNFLSWRARNLTDQAFVIILSIIIGFLAGVAAAILKVTVITIGDKLFSFYSDTDTILLLIGFPVIGILLTVIFLKYIVKDNVGHGVPRILYVISKLDGSMRNHKIFSSLVGGSLTAGFGGSVGLESPIISTGASIGSSIGQLLKLSYKHKTLLIGCGAAGAMASIFTTPIAAVIFSFEVLLLNLSASALIPILMASVTGAVTTKLLTAEQYLVHFKVTEEFIIQDLPYYIILGIIGGFVAVYFHYMHFKIIQQFERIKSIWAKAIIGGGVLGLLLYLMPPLYSEGYDAIRLIVSGKSNELLNYTFVDGSNAFLTLTIFVVLLIIFKVIATTLTTEAGGVGGIFAPAAVMGGLTGFVLSSAINELSTKINLHESNFTLVGMASVLGAVLMAPLTAIFLVAEMSNGYELIVPLMLSTSIAYMIAKRFNKHSIFTQKLAEQGDMYEYKDMTVIKQLSIRSLLENDVLRLNLKSTLGDLVKLIKKTKRNIFIVIDDDDHFIGLVLLVEVRNVMFDTSKYSDPISKFLYSPLSDEKVNVDSDARDVINKFNKTGNYNMIVLEGTKYVGMISKANLLKEYRSYMIADIEHI